MHAVEELKIRPEKVLVFLDKQLATTEMPLTKIDSFWFKGLGFDITIEEDVRGDPYIIVGIKRIGAHMKFQEIDNSWRGKTIKRIDTDSIKRECGGQTRIPRKTVLKNLAYAR